MRSVLAGETISRVDEPLLNPALMSTQLEHFSHEAMFYGDMEEFIKGCTHFIQDGVERDETVLVVVPREKIEPLRSSLDGSVKQVRFADMADVGTNPARIIPAWTEFAAEQKALGRGFRGIGEPIYVGRTQAELAECRRHEALLNVAFEGSGAWRLLCPYDTTNLSPDLIEAARHTHPILVEGGASSDSDLYPGTHHHAAPFEELLAEPPSPSFTLEFGPGTLEEVRRFVSQRCAEAGLGVEGTVALVVAVNEIATNSIRHGGGRGSVRSWVVADSLIVEVADRGLVPDPLVGRLPPAATANGGRGLWMVNQLCDLVQQRTTDSGTVTRLHMYLPSRAA